jgi:protein involved in temperature-dependent protein secretion
VPLSKIQTDVLRLLAGHRDPESDRQERVTQAALNDANVLETAGYHVQWLRQLPMLYTAAVTKDVEGTRLEWVVDSDYRFFPVVRDDAFGYVLHPVDLAMNKLMAAAGRRELRDLSTWSRFTKQFCR